MLLDKQASCAEHSLRISPPFSSLRTLDSSLSRFINVLLRQLEQAIQCPFVMLKVTTAIRIEDSGIHHFGKTNALALLDLLDSAGVPFMRWLLGNGPIRLLRARHPISRFQDVFLADRE